MIVESIVDVFFSTISMAFSGLEIVGLPLQTINTLSTILVYGVWVVGADILALFVGFIVGWWGIKFLVGLVVWVWELLPMT